MNLNKRKKGGRIFFKKREKQRGEKDEHAGTGRRIRDGLSDKHFRGVIVIISENLNCLFYYLLRKTGYKNKRGLH